MRENWVLRHAGFIVKDIDKAVAYYRSLGFPAVGPEGVMKDPDGNPRLKVNFVQVGSFQIEFFQPMGGKSMQQDFLDKHGEGIQHLAFKVDDLDQEIETLTRDGWEIVFRRDATSGSRIAYFKTGAIGDVLIELVQPAPGTK